MWELDHKEGWALKNWWFWTVVLEKTLEHPKDSKEVKTINPKGSQPRIFIGKTDTEVEAPILEPPDAKSWLIGKDLDAGKDWGQEEKGMTEDEMVGWHHYLSSHLFMTQWSRIWVNCGRWWRIEEPGVLRSTGSQRVQHNLATEQQQFKETGIIVLGMQTWGVCVVQVS